MTAPAAAPQALPEARPQARPEALPQTLPEARPDLAFQAQAAAAMLKALAHEGRLQILCALATGERSVGELEALLGVRQAAVSQHLARLRADGLVSARRDGKTIHYALDDPRAARLIGTLHAIYCAEG